MKSFAKKVLRFLRCEEGPTAVEYAMLLMLVFVAVLSMVTVLGQTTATSFQESGNSIVDAIDP